MAGPAPRSRGGAAAFPDMSFHDALTLAEAIDVLAAFAALVLAIAATA